MNMVFLNGTKAQVQKDVDNMFPVYPMLRALNPKLLANISTLAAILEGIKCSPDLSSTKRDKNNSN